MEDQWLTITEAAEHFGVSANAIRMRLRRRQYAATELRDGVRYINVTADRPTETALVIPTDHQTSTQIERLIAAQERTNELLERQLALLQQQPKKWRWPWSKITDSSS